ncbi:MAG: hypothetical protein FJ147_22355 [Deltaproteobacteria bacterium]|nr:hypothetical protein [Deltaproteobacteria bacterium]
MKTPRLRLVPPKRQTVNKDNATGPVLHTNLTIIEVSDPFLLQTLRADRRIGAAITVQLSDRVAVVQPRQADMVIKQLLKAGHTPKVIDV